MIKIYTLADPDTKEVRYVGKTKQALLRRLSYHKYEAKMPKKTSYRTNWINSLLKQGKEPIIELLDTTNDIDNWQWLEIYWIGQLRNWGFKLVNLTDGGDGNNNQVFSRESIEKRTAKLRGQKRTPEQRKNISDSLIGVIRSQETRDKIRDIVIAHHGIPIIQMDMEDNYIREWRCMKDAATFYNTNQSNIRYAVIGKYKQAKGFKWKRKMKI